MQCMAMQMDNRDSLTLTSADDTGCPAYHVIYIHSNLEHCAAQDRRHPDTVASEKVCIYEKQEVLVRFVTASQNSAGEKKI